MLILGIDTTTKTAAVAVVNYELPLSLRATPLGEGGFKILSEMQSCGGISHSENLMPMIDYTLKSAGVLLDDIDLFRQKAEKSGFVFNHNKFYDPYRIVLNCENSGEKLYYFLAGKNIVCEFFTGDSVIIIPSISNTSSDFDKLYDVLSDYARNNKIIPVQAGKFVYPPGVPDVLPEGITEK